MLKLITLKLKRRASAQRRIVSAPCSWCSTVCLLKELIPIRVRNGRVHVCKSCLEGLE